MINTMRGGLCPQRPLRRGRDARQAPDDDRRRPDIRGKHPRRLLTLCTLTIVSLSIAGCGGSGTPAVTAQANAPTAETAATTAESTTPPSASSGSPELILCREETLDSPDLIALSGGAEGVSATTLASFSGTAETTACSVSPDLTKIAEISTTSEGSKVAGYLSSDGGGFVNVSGHEHLGYSGVPHTDEDAMFNPATGELWWTSEGQMWSAPVNGGTPQEHGKGQLAGFTESGEPLPDQEPMSPDGSVGAIIDPTEPTGGYYAVGLGIGRSNALTPTCLNHAGAIDSENGGIEPLASECPGVAVISFPESTRAFTGFVSDSTFIAEVDESSGQHFALNTFRLAGKKLQIVNSVPLTPPTTMKIAWAAVSPDGKTLWYLATSGGESQPEAEEETHLYIVSTTTPTHEPSAVQVTPPNSAVAADKIIGWRWNGHWLDGAP